jgi:L-asparaginase
MFMMDPIGIITTGGTLDKVHNTRTESLDFPPDGQTHLPDLLKTARCYFPLVQTVLMKDSLDFTPADRHAILDAVQQAPENRIVITHGTGTMGETARFLAGHVTDKTVILTGAMRPFSLSASDADFNMGGAIVAAQILGHGVWGVMNGRVFAAKDLDKNTQTGRFDG